MKQELINKLTPIIDKFADEVLATFKDIHAIRKGLIDKQAELDLLIQAKEKEIADFKEKRTQDKEALDKRLAELEITKSDYLLKCDSYDKLLKDLKEQQKILSKEEDNSLITLARAKDMETRARHLKEEQEKLRNQYELKLDSLKHDTEKIEKDRAQIDLDRKALSNRESDLTFKETRLNKIALELNDQENLIKFERGEVNKLINKLGAKWPQR